MATLLVAGLTTAVTIGGWIALHRFTALREIEARKAADARADYARRLEIRLKQTESKISEFYGPVHGLVNQILAMWAITERMSTELNDKDKMRAIEHYLNERYFLPMHERIRSLMIDKRHLIEGETMPKSFYDYIQHSMMQTIQVNLWDEKQIDTRSVPGIGWPPDFPKDVQNRLMGAIRTYDGLKGELSVPDSTAARSL